MTEGSGLPEDATKQSKQDKNSDKNNVSKELTQKTGKPLTCCAYGTMSETT